MGISLPMKNAKYEAYFMVFHGYFMEFYGNSMDLYNPVVIDHVNALFLYIEEGTEWLSVKVRCINGGFEPNCMLKSLAPFNSLLNQPCTQTIQTSV